jgi:hypothetical protein
MDNPNKLIHDLKQFTGTEQYYKNPLFPDYVYTDGIKYLAEKAGAYWLIDYIFIYQSELDLSCEPFQVWKFKVVESKGKVIVEDGNKKILKEYNLEFTDFPLPEIELWFTDRTLLLTSEY